MRAERKKYIFRIDKNVKKKEWKEKKLRAFYTRPSVPRNMWVGLGVGKQGHWMPIENKIVNTWKFYNEHMCARF